MANNDGWHEVPNMKTITVPNDWGNPVVVEINTGEKVVLTAGTTVSVPEEVASVIENALANKPKENPPAPTGKMIVHAKIIDEDGNVSIDKSFSDILNAIKSGLDVMIRLELEYDNFVDLLFQSYNGNLVFSCSYTEGYNIAIFSLEINEGDGVNLYQYEI